jgi:lipopolysaccharide/colanic/teichoic acid biosynthesis glycosyltransferase
VRAGLPGRILGDTVSEMKRLFDVLTSSMALLFLSPILLVIALAIKLESEGPVLFRQTRVGENRRPFTMYKFRKFPISYDGHGPGVTLSDDYRLTRIGRILERLKLDELPQFLNVLKGDMCLVGPRPETPNFVKYYSESDHRVLEVKPGIFGINQLLFRREAELYPEGVDPEEFYVSEIMPRKLANDIEYLQRNTFATDLALLIKCVWNAAYEPLHKMIARKQTQDDRLRKSRS